jgi:hypothetical protein
MKKIITYIIIVGLVSFVSSLLTVLYLHNTSNPKAEKKQNMVQAMKVVYDELELNDNQTVEFNKITGDFHMLNKTISKEIKLNLYKYYKELSNEQPDSILLDNYAKTNGELNQKLMQNSNWYFRHAEGILDNSQVEKLKDIFKYATKNFNKDK